jgi:Flp pilus assembly protein TadD
MAQLRLRIGQLLGRLASRQASDKAAAARPTVSLAPVAEAPAPAMRPAKTPLEEEPTTPPLDPLALGRTLFRAHDYASAMKAFRQVNQTGMKPEERRPIEYLIATCLKRLGKVDEAAAIYREVASSKGDEILAECAQWQLNTLRWEREFEQQFRQPQQRLRDLENKP